MATVRKLTEDFLTCPICTEVFQDPCTLQCEHTFCRSCLRRHIEAQPQVVQYGSLVCPFCRRSTPVLGTDAPVEEWIKSLKQSRLIGGLMDSLVHKSEEIEMCSICKDEGTTTPATSWCSECDSTLCESCLRMHQRMPYSRSHKVTGNVAEMKTYPRIQKMRCKEHDKKMKMFCKECNQTMCTLCCGLNHRMCTRVVTTQSMMPEVKQAIQDKLTINSKRIQEINMYITKRKLMFEDKEENCNKVRQDIDTAVDKMMKMLQDKKKQLVADVDEELQKQRDDLKAKVKLGEMDIQIYQQKAEFISQALEHNSEEDLFQMFQDREIMGDNSAVDWKKDEPLQSDVYFKHDLQRVELLISEMTVYTDLAIDFSIPPKSDQKLYCRITGDSKIPSLRDVVAVAVNGVDAVVVTDWNNSSVKCFYKENTTSCHSTLKCQTFSLALLEHHQAAATVPDSKQIIVFDIKPELVLTSTVTTGKSYYGLDVLNPTTLVVSAPHSTPPSVDIVDITGAVMKSFTDLPSIQSSIKATWYVHVTSKGNILISDDGHESLTCITQQGEVVFHYKPTDQRRLNGPRGIVTTTDGDILLADYRRSVIVQLTDTGDFVRDIPIQRDQLKCVVGLYVKERSLYVASLAEGLTVFTYGGQ